MKGPTRGNRTALAVLMLIWALSVSEAYGYSGGISGRTLKSSQSGCGSCHSNTASSSVSITINGPTSVVAGQSASFTVTVSGSSGSNGGVDIAAKNGTLTPVSSFLKLLSGELVHNASVAVPSTYQFTYTAPAAPGSDTLYATGKDNTSAWNWAPNKPISVTAATLAAPMLASPADAATNQSTTLSLSWNATAGATSYRLQLSTDQLFSAMLLDDSTITATSRQVGPLPNSTTYYWRVRAKNLTSTSPYSTTRSFTTIVAVPVAPTLVSPGSGKTGQSTTVTFIWNASAGATSYRLQVSTKSQFNSTVFDDSAITSTSRQVGPLSNNSTFYWRVRAKNSAGISAYSAAWSFSTALTGVDEHQSIPARLSLGQNYPNPFNPSTCIDYTIPQSAKVTLKIYDILGREIATIVDDWEAAGFYTVRFESQSLPSGIYFYSLQAGEHRETKRLVLVR